MKFFVLADRDGEDLVFRYAMDGGVLSDVVRIAGGAFRIGFNPHSVYGSHIKKNMIGAAEADLTFRVFQPSSGKLLD